MRPKPDSTLCQVCILPLLLWSDIGAILSRCRADKEAVGGQETQIERRRVVKNSRLKHRQRDGERRRFSGQNLVRFDNFRWLGFYQTEVNNLPENLPKDIFVPKNPQRLFYIFETCFWLLLLLLGSFGVWVKESTQEWNRMIVRCLFQSRDSPTICCNTAMEDKMVYLCKWG